MGVCVLVCLCVGVCVCVCPHIYYILSTKIYILPAKRGCVGRHRFGVKGFAGVVSVMYCAYESIHKHRRTRVHVCVCVWVRASVHVWFVLVF